MTELQKIITELKTFDCLELGAFNILQDKLAMFEDAINLDVPAHFIRARLICENALKRAAEIRTDYLDHVLSYQDENQITTSTMVFEKNVKQVENLVKLTMQRLMASFKQLQDANREGGDEQS